MERGAPIDPALVEISEEMRRQGISQKMLAGHLNRSQSYTSEMLHGQTGCTLAVLRQMAALVGLRVTLQYAVEVRRG